MSKKSLFIGAVASIIAINSVFGDTTVTSRQYVDNQDDAVYNELDEIKQDIIPAAGTNASIPGSAVVTYTGTAGQIGERFICDADADDNGYCNDDNLVTLDLLGDQMDDFGNYFSEQILTNLPRTTTTNKVCTEWVAGQAQTDANCLLWNLTDQTVYGCLADGASCSSRSQCCGGYCDFGYCASPQY